MSEQLLFLERAIESDLEAIEALHREIEGAAPDDATSQEALIVTAYRLHNLYRELFPSRIEGFLAFVRGLEG